MLCRGYSELYKAKHPTYEDVTVCEEWHKLSNFKAWMECQDWEGKQLDKDILVVGNKVYSPDTCVFVTKNTNCFMIECDASRGEYPIGVSFHKASGKFQAQIQGAGKGNKYLGIYNTTEEAHQVWLTEKTRFAKILAAEQTDPRVAKAILDRYVNYKGESK